MSLIGDLKILFHMLTAKAGSGSDHKDRLEAFYKGQRNAYDNFRKRLLHGRERMMKLLPLPVQGGTLIDVGGGTGSNIEALGDRITELDHIEIVDLCESLLEVAKERIEARNWKNVLAVNADATNYQPAKSPDIVTFSYSLTMIPDWFAVIDKAFEMLKPGGLIGVVDFYVSRKWPEKGMKKHSAWTRGFWPAWFSYDNVFVSPEHLPYLMNKFNPVIIEEWRGNVPYMLGMKAPYYVFVGRKPF